jgi:hypothetical protein
VSVWKNLSEKIGHFFSALRRIGLIFSYLGNARRSKSRFSQLGNPMPNDIAQMS